MKAKLTEHERQRRRANRAKPGQGIKRSGARLTIGAEWDEGFEVVRAISVVLWPGRRGSRKVRLGQVSQPISDSKLAEFVASCRKTILGVVGDGETAQRLTAELHANLSQVQARDVSARTVIEAGELVRFEPVDERLGVALPPELLAAWRRLSGDV